MEREILRLQNMRFHAYHGVLPKEKSLGQRFEVDLEVAAGLRKAAQTDRIEDTIDYAQLFNLVKEAVTEERFNLIETLAERIAEKVAQRFPVSELTVRVRKPNPPLDGNFDYVEVEIHREIQQ